MEWNLARPGLTVEIGVGGIFPGPACFRVDEDLPVDRRHRVIELDLGARGARQRPSRLKAAHNEQKERPEEIHGCDKESLEDTAGSGENDRP